MAYFPNPHFAAEFVSEEETLADLAANLEEAKTLAQSFAPVAEGDYRDSIGIVIADGKVYLAGFDWKSIFIEYGTSQPGPTPAFAPLRRALIAAGYEFEDTRET